MESVSSSATSCSLCPVLVPPCPLHWRTPTLPGQDVRQSLPPSSPSVFEISSLRGPPAVPAWLASPHCIFSRGSPNWFGYKILHHLYAKLKIISVCNFVLELIWTSILFQHRQLRHETKIFQLWMVSERDPQPLALLFLVFPSIAHGASGPGSGLWARGCRGAVL